MPSISTRQGLQDAGTYASGATYHQDDPVIYSGAWYLSLVSSNIGHQPDTSPTQWSPLSAHLSSVFRGNYSSGTTYATGDTIHYTDGSAYVSLQNSNVGKTPGVDTAWWGILASAASGGLTPAQATTILSSIVSSPNRLDATRVVQGYVSSADGSIVGSGAPITDGSGYTTSPLFVIGDNGHWITTATVFAYGGIAGPQYAIDGTYIGPSSTSDIAAGTPIATLAGATFARIVQQNTSPTQWAGIMVNPGSAVSPFTPFFSWANVTSADAAVLAAAKPWQGKKALFVGDSITSGGQWASRVVAQLGLANVNLSNYPAVNELGAYSSGTTYNAGDLVYTGGSTGTYWYALNTSTGQTPSTSPSHWANVALAHDLLGNAGHYMSDAYLQYATNFAANSGGPTITQQLATALSDKDILFLFYGTNDQATTLGSLGNSPVAPGATTSFYGSCEYMMQTAANAVALTGRNIKVIVITPYHQTHLTSSTSTTLAQVVQAIKDVAGEYGFSVLDSTREMGINSLTWTSFLIDEGSGIRLHPVDPLGYDLVGRSISGFTLSHQ